MFSCILLRTLRLAKSPFVESGRFNSTIVEEKHSGLRLDRFLSVQYPTIPRALVFKLIRTKKITVSSAAEPETKRRAHPDDRLETGMIVNIPPKFEDDAAVAGEGIGEKMSDQQRDLIRSYVLYKDNHVIVINKPSGLPVQGGPKSQHNLDRMLPALQYEAEECPRLVHRLDKDTSGVMLLARTRQAASELAAMFKTTALRSGRAPDEQSKQITQEIEENKVKKTYWAFVLGQPSPKSGRIRLPLQKVRTEDGERIVGREDIILRKNEKKRKVPTKLSKQAEAELKRREEEEERMASETKRKSIHRREVVEEDYDELSDDDILDVDGEEETVTDLTPIQYRRSGGDLPNSSGKPNQPAYSVIASKEAMERERRRKLAALDLAAKRRAAEEKGEEFDEGEDGEGKGKQLSKPKMAITEYTVMDSGGGVGSWIEMFPITGRTHQLRVHCAEALKTPILGDVKYGGKCPDTLRGVIAQPTRLHLHARSVTFPLLGSNGRRTKTVIAPLPKHMLSTQEMFPLYLAKGLPTS